MTSIRLFQPYFYVSLFLSAAASSAPTSAQQTTLLDVYNADFDTNLGGDLFIDGDDYEEEPIHREPHVFEDYGGGEREREREEAETIFPDLFEYDQYYGKKQQKEKKKEEKPKKFVPTYKPKKPTKEEISKASKYYDDDKSTFKREVPAFFPNQGFGFGGGHDVHGGGSGGGKGFGAFRGIHDFIASFPGGRDGFRHDPHAAPPPPPSYHPPPKPHFDVGGGFKPSFGGGIHQPFRHDPYREDVHDFHAKPHAPPPKPHFKPDFGHEFEPHFEEPHKGFRHHGDPYHKPKPHDPYHNPKPHHDPYQDHKPHHHLDYLHVTYGGHDPYHGRKHVSYGYGDAPPHEHGKDFGPAGFADGGPFGGIAGGFQ